jgi:hypothetical protein
VRLPGGDTISHAESMPVCRVAPPGPWAFLLLRLERMEQPVEDKSIGVQIRELTETLTALFKTEIALAKAEIQQGIGKAAVGVGLFAAAAVLAVFAFALLVTAGVLALSLVLQPWAAALIVAVVFLIGAVLLAMMGKSRMSDASVMPTGAVEGMKTDVQVVKAGLSAAKER